MRIHREGYDIIGLASLFLGALAILAYPRHKGVLLGLVSLWVAIVAFFRWPQRTPPALSNAVLAPADGTIVKIERLHEGEFLGDERLMISIFLSVFNVHLNWIPLAGKVVYRCYHPGQYLVAFHPKASLLNERSTVVIETPQGQQVLVRQIAGLIARRISTYPALGATVQAGQELGFIKFGSRVDVVLPPQSQAQVQLYQRVRGAETILAQLP
jgi:phosphatidylserine decarboxylase